MVRKFVRTFMVFLLVSALFVSLQRSLPIPEILPSVPPVQAPYWNGGGSDVSWFYNDSESGSYTASASWQEKVSLTFTPNETANYLVMAFASVDSNLPAHVQFTHTVDSEEVIGGGDFPMVTSADAYYVPFNTMWYSELNTSTHVFNLTYRSTSGSRAIRYARIIAWKLSEFVTEYATSDGESSTSSTNWQTKTTLTFGGVNSQWVIIASSELRTDASWAFQFRLNVPDDTATVMTSDITDGSDRRYYTFSVYVLSASSLSRTITTQWRSIGAHNSWIARSRIFAMKLADFNSTTYGWGRAFAYNTTNSNPYTVLGFSVNWTGSSTLALMSTDFTGPWSGADYMTVRNFANASDVSDGAYMLQHSQRGYQSNYTSAGSFKVSNITEDNRYHYINITGTASIAWMAIRQANIFLIQLQEEPPSSVIIDDIEIDNMEGCGNWIFAEEKYYNFRVDMQSVNISLIDYIGISFLDFISNNITVMLAYNGSTTYDVWSVVSGEDQINLQTGSYTFGNTSELTTMNVTFPLYLESRITDTLNMSIWGFANETDASSTGWAVYASDYVSIYNLGGQDLGSLTTSGTAGRLPGGDVFDFYAQNNSEVEASMIFRHLQHVKMLPEVSFMYDSGANYATFRLTYGIDYCLSNGNDFITGWEVELLANEIDIVGERHINFTISWYARDPAGGGLYESKPDDLIYFYTRAVAGDDLNGTTRIWFDFWFNRVNASTTVAGRVNAFEYPMKDSAPGWMALWGASTWGVDDLMSKESMMLDRLRDTDGNVTSASQVKLVRVRFKLQVYSGSENQIVTVQDYNVFDLTIGDKTEPMQGIQTPTFDETRVPTMQVGGFLGAIWSGLVMVADAIARAVGPALLGFWNAFVGFLDTIFAWLGFPNAFSQFIALLTNAWNWFIISVIYVTTMMVQSFLFLAEVMGKFISLFTTLITQWISMAQWFWWMLDTGFYSTVSIWDTLDMGTWVIIGAILYPIHIVFLWDEYGEQAAIAEVTFLINIFLMLAKGFLTLISFTINILFSLVEMIPIAE